MNFLRAHAVIPCWPGHSGVGRCGNVGRVIPKLETSVGHDEDPDRAMAPSAIHIAGDDDRGGGRGGELGVSATT
jgi:hypothetical protein